MGGWPNPYGLETSLFYTKVEPNHQYLVFSNLFLQQDESIQESDSASSTPGAGAGHGTWQPKYLKIIMFI